MKAAWSVDWLQTTNAERRCLFAPMDRVRRSRDIDWQDVWREAFGADHGLGLGYEENCRKGTMGRPRAAGLFEWLAINDRLEAESAEDAVLRIRAGLEDDVAGRIRWEDYIREIGRFSNIKLLPAPPGQRNLVAIARMEPRDLGTVSLGERFYLQFDCPRAGTLAIVMGYRRKWYVMEPGDRMSFLAIKSAGSVVLPASDYDRAAEALSEETDIGKHRFVFILAPDREALTTLSDRAPGISIAESDLDDLATTLSSLGHAVLIHRCSIMVKP